MTKALDPDVKALSHAVRALDRSSSRRMLLANLEFLWDRYFGNPTDRLLPDHLRQRPEKESDEG
jgi:hypothetical protein